MSNFAIKVFKFGLHFHLNNCLIWIVELLSELAKREKEAGIFPEADVDLFMKVKTAKLTAIFLL